MNIVSLTCLCCEEIKGSGNQSVFPWWEEPDKYQLNKHTWLEPANLIQSISLSCYSPCPTCCWEFFCLRTSHYLQHSLLGWSKNTFPAFLISWKAGWIQPHLLFCLPGTEKTRGIIKEPRSHKVWLHCCIHLWGFQLTRPGFIYHNKKATHLNHCIKL